MTLTMKEILYFQLLLLVELRHAPVRDSSLNAIKASNVIQYCPKELTAQQNQTKSLTLPTATLKKNKLLLLKTQCYNQCYIKFLVTLFRSDIVQ